MTKYQVQRSVLGLLLIVFSMTLSAQDFSADGALLKAYLTDDMPAWKAHIDVRRDDVQSTKDLLYEYGYCGYIVAEAKKDGKETLLPEAKRYVQRFRRHTEEAKGKLPKGYYEMYMSAVYVYELRLRESFHPVKSLELAREAVKLAPEDPMTLCYCATALFYAPKPFGNKKEALELFLKAEKRFEGKEWYHCWWRPATKMYIVQCYQKAGNKKEALRRAQDLLREYPEYGFVTSLIPALQE